MQEEAEIVEEPEVMDDSQGAVSSRHSRTDRHMNSENRISCTTPTQAQITQKPRTRKGKWAQSPAFKQEAICNLFRFGKGTLVLQWSAAGFINFVPRQAFAQEKVADTKSKKASMFHTFCFSLEYSVLFIYVFIYVCACVSFDF